MTSRTANPSVLPLASDSPATGAAAPIPANNRTRLVNHLLGGAYNPHQPPPQEGHKGLEVMRCSVIAASPRSTFTLQLPPAQVQVQFALVSIIDVSTEQEHIELQVLACLARVILADFSCSASCRLCDAFLVVSVFICRFSDNLLVI